MDSLQNIFIVAGAILIITGLLWQFGGKFGLFRLPGDIAVEKENFRFYFPLTTSILLSIILSAVFFIVSRLK